MKKLPIVLLIALLAIWLLLNSELSWASLALGIVVAMVFALSLTTLRPIRPNVRNLHVAIPLIAVVLIDIVRSNLAVSRIILGLTGTRAVHSGFLDIPLELRDPHGLAVLAVIVTSTPGTAWAGLSEDGRTLRLHVLDLKDEEQWVRTFKQHYEQRLLKIFA